MRPIVTSRFLAGLFVVALLLPSRGLAAQIGILERVSPFPTPYVLGTEFLPFVRSGLGDVTALLQAVDLILPPDPTPNTSTSGCDAADFSGFVAGRIALMQRGTCAFELKATNAFAAGAIGAIIFNEGQPGRTEVVNAQFLALGAIPAVSTSFSVGNFLAALVLSAGPVTMRLQVSDSSPPEVAEVPEPATLALVGLGLGAVAVRLRRPR